jgi:hypothetical protein
MALKLVGNYRRQPGAMAFGVASFAGGSLFHLSLPLVVLVLAPLAMAWYWPRGTLPPATEGRGEQRH